jgi:hypothetical protein
MAGTDKNNFDFVFITILNIADYLLYFSIQ